MPSGGLFNWKKKKNFMLRKCVYNIREGGKDSPRLGKRYSLLSKIKDLMSLIDILKLSVTETF